jgi:hypothetical protein
VFEGKREGIDVDRSGRDLVRGCVQPVHDWEGPGGPGEDGCEGVPAVLGTHEGCEWLSIDSFTLEWRGERQRYKLIVRDVEGEEMRECEKGGRERGEQVVGEVERGEGHQVCEGWREEGEFVLV